MQQEGTTHNTTSDLVAISAAEQAGRWEQALSIRVELALKKTKARQLDPKYPNRSAQEAMEVAEYEDALKLLQKIESTSPASNYSVKSVYPLLSTVMEACSILGCASAHQSYRAQEEACKCATCLAAASFARVRAEAPLRSRGLVPQPRMIGHDGKWCFGEVDAREIRQNHRHPPQRFSRVVKYALMRMAAASSGSSDQTPPVKISKCPLNGDWVVKDGAHRLYAAILSGLPLRCKWRMQHKTYAEVRHLEGSRLAEKVDKDAFWISNRSLVDLLQD